MSVGLLRMPRLGETMEEGRLVTWLVEPGKPFRRGDVIAEVETDKTVVEVPALGPGTVMETLAEPGATVAVGAPIARVEVGDGIDWTRDADDGTGESEDAGSSAADTVPGGEGGDPAAADGADPESGSGRVVVDLLMPRLGETMEEGVLVGWLVEAGAAFTRGDPLLEVETDKTVAEFPALADGVIEETLAREGDRIAVGTPIARVEIAAGDRAAMLGEAAGAADTSSPADGPAAREAPAPATRAGAGATGGPRRATPLARRIARQRGVDLAGVTGTGRRGRIEKRDVEAAAARSASKGEGLQVRAGIAFREQGPADGAPVLLVHGFAADLTAWAATAAQLARAGRRTIAIDLPSHGKTEREAGDAGALGDALSEFADEAFGGAPVHVVAHSLGAVPATDLAARGLARSLTLIAPAGLGLSIDADFIRGLVEARTPGEVGHLLRRMTAGPLGLSETAVAAIAGDLSRGRLAGLADSALGARGQAIDIRGTLAELAVRVPVRFILGHRDRIIDWRESLDVSPRIAVHHLPQAGHMPHWEAPGDVVAILATATEDP